MATAQNFQVTLYRLYISDMFHISTLQAFSLVNRFVLTGLQFRGESLFPSSERQKTLPSETTIYFLKV